MDRTQYNSFVSKLQEIFMMDHAELDFGIYRIMNYKRKEINDFLTNKLLPQVEAVLKQNLQTDSDDIKEELDKAIAACIDNGFNPDESKKVQELRAKLASSANLDDLQSVVFSRLTQFFSRYYKDGDFVSQRRYKSNGDSSYMLPYNGEEVKLVWANQDQYYIKTSEYFKNYTFILPKSRNKVHFVLKDASTEQNNNKNQNGMERRFALWKGENGEAPLAVVNEELEIYFTYELMPKATKQKDLMAKAYSVLKTLIESDDRFKNWQELLMLAVKADRSLMDITWLQKHLNDYTAKNSFDYFIHKDLGGFLRRELDFYIKNEVLVIDDLTSAKMKSTLAIVKAIEQVGNKIITFLAQLEDFQKKLWLKKKFVVGCDYCITLDRIPEDMYPEIIANDEQRKEWVRLFAIDEIKGDMMTEAYSEPLTIEFLKQNPFLVLDTKFFSLEFKHKLLATMEDIDGQCNGLLIHSDNFHGLRICKDKFFNSINGFYIDPPYNTGTDSFLYKDNYMHSSWLAMMQDRLNQTSAFLTKEGSIAISINENELYNLKELMDTLYPKYLTSLTVKVRHEDRILKGDKDFHEVYENTLMYSNSTDFKPLKRIKDNTSLDDYVWEVKVVGPPCNIISMGKKDVEVYAPDSFVLSKSIPSEKLLKRISVRGSIREGNSSGRFYVSNLEIIADKYPGFLFKVPNMGDDGLGYRYFWTPSAESKRKNGDYFQGKPTSANDEREIPYPNFVDFEKEFNNCGDEGGIEYRNGKKPISFLKHILNLQKINVNQRSFVMDFFAGSGSTGHTVIEMNRRDAGQRKYILMQMGEIFDSALFPRLMRSIYSKDWSKGIPLSRQGISQCFKYIRLEQYEDTLNNLIPKPSMPSNDDEFQESYMLGYMLDTDTRGSLLNLQMFKHPFDVKIKITKDNELVDTPVDMVETFNYLIGLNVETESWHHGGDICVVEGNTHIGNENTLVIWRDCEKIDNDALNEFFRKQDFNTLDMEYDVIYVNGDNTLPNVRRDEDHWKVVLTEDEFKKRMFEEE